MASTIYSEVVRELSAKTRAELLERVAQGQDTLLGTAIVNREYGIRETMYAEGEVSLPLPESAATSTRFYVTHRHGELNDACYYSAHDAEVWLWMKCEVQLFA